MNEFMIRRFQKEDLMPLYELLSDPEVMRYIEPPYTLKKTEQFLAEAGTCEKPLIYAAEHDGSLIGYVIFHDYDPDSKEIGWILKKSVWGKGYAEALSEILIEKAKAEGKTAVIECAPEQKATKHIAEKIGFSYIGKRDGLDVYKLMK